MNETRSETDILKLSAGQTTGRYINNTSTYGSAEGGPWSAFEATEDTVISAITLDNVTNGANIAGSTIPNRNIQFGRISSIALTSGAGILWK